MSLGRQPDQGVPVPTITSNCSRFAGWGGSSKERMYQSWMNVEPSPTA